MPTRCPQPPVPAGACAGWRDIGVAGSWGHLWDGGWTLSLRAVDGTEHEDRRPPGHCPPAFLCSLSHPCPWGSPTAVPQAPLVLVPGPRVRGSSRPPLPGPPFVFVCLWWGEAAQVLGQPGPVLAVLALTWAHMKASGHSLVCASKGVGVCGWRPPPRLRSGRHPAPRLGAKVWSPVTLQHLYRAPLGVCGHAHAHSLRLTRSL